MRRIAFLSAVAPLALAASLTAASAQEASAPNGKAVTLTSDLAGMGMDPLLDNTGSVKVFTDEIHLNGIMQDTDGNLIPGAATKWEVSEDLLSWIWTVREGVKFHDGSIMTPEDFAWSWKRHVMSEDSENPYHAGYSPLIEDIYAEGNTVIVKTKKPEPLMPLWWPTYDNQVGYVLSKAQYEREGVEGLRTKPIGAGNFKLAALSTEDRYVDLEAFEDHYCCVPKVKNLRIMEVPELSTRIALLRTGEADLIEATPTAKKDIEAAGLRTISGNAGAVSTIWYLYQNFSNNPFNDQRVRESISIAIDRAAITERLYAGEGGPLSSFNAAPGTAGYSDDLEPDPYNPERAKQLMADAGYPDGFPVRIMTYSFDGDFPNLPTLSQAVLGYLQELNITGDVQVMEWNALKTEMENMLKAACGGMTVCTEEEAANKELGAQQPYTLIVRGDKSRYDSLRQNRQYQSTLANTIAMIQYPEVDSALDAITREFDTTKQNELFQEYNKLLREKFYNAPLIFANTIFGASDRVAGWEPIPGRPFPNNHWTLEID